MTGPRRHGITAQTTAKQRRQLYNLDVVVHFRPHQNAGNNNLRFPPHHKCYGCTQRGPFPGTKYVIKDSPVRHVSHCVCSPTVGWSSSQPLNANAGFQYDQNGYGVAQPEAGIKSRLIDLISAVRTLMRSTWLAYKVYTAC